MNKLVKFIDKVGVDRVLHFVCGFAICAFGFPFGKDAFIYFFVFTILVGIVKECIDRQLGGGFDGKDMVATWLGAIFAFVYIFVVYEIMF